MRSSLGTGVASFRPQLLPPLGQLPDSDRVIFCVIRWHSSKSWRPSSAAICIRWATNLSYASSASGTECEEVSLVPRADHRFTSDWTRASQPRLACSNVSSSSFLLLNNSGLDAFVGLV